jgi:hypothetical protein
MLAQVSPRRDATPTTQQDARGVEAVFEAAALQLLRRADVERGPILHSDGLKTGGKFFAFVAKGDLVVKLPAERVKELIARDEGGVFDAGKGRPMREWVRLRPATTEACAAHMDEAREFVARREGEGPGRKG